MARASLESHTYRGVGPDVLGAADPAEATHRTGDLLSLLPEETSPQAGICAM